MTGRTLKTILLGAVLMPALFAQGKKEQIPAGEWPRYKRDLAGTVYSPLAQISTQNVAKLTPAWKYLLRTEKERAAPATGFSYSEITPIVVGGVMYLTAGSRVLALDPSTGKEIWVYELKQGRLSTRGVTYWPGDKDNPPRIIVAAGGRMIALNAKNGQPNPGFGKEGEVDLVVPYNSPPTIYKNLDRKSVV